MGGRRVSTYGMFAKPQVSSLLHAEFQALICAMEATLQLGFTSMRESDCLQLVKLIEEEEDWPSIALELDTFFITHSLF